MGEEHFSKQHFCLDREIQKTLAENSKALIINIVLSSIFSITATLGNLLVLVSKWRSSNLNSPSMILVCGLAVSDLCVGFISEPMFIGSYISLFLKGKAVPCLFVSIKVTVTVHLTDVNLLTITAITIDRYLAIYFHLRYEEVVTQTRAKVVIACLWIISGLHLLAWIRGFEALAAVMAALLSVCLVTVSFIWIKIYQVVRHHQAQIQDQFHAQAQQFNMLRFRKSVVNNFMILLVFLVCYVPYLVSSINLAREFNGSNLLTHVFLYSFILLKSSLNPLLYCCRQSDIRAATKQTLRQLFCLTQGQ